MLTPETQSIVDNSYREIPYKKWREADKRLLVFLRNLIEEMKQGK